MSRWLACLPFSYLLFLFLFPMVIIISYSFFERDFSGQVTASLSSEGWREATDAVTLAVLARSMAIAFAVTAVCLILGYPCALSMARMSHPARQICIALIGFPLITSNLLRTYGWMNILPLGWRGNAATIGVVMVSNFLPFMVLPLLRAWERVDRSLELASLDLGATRWRAFWHVTWPLTRSGMWAGCAMVFIPSTGEYLVPHFIGEGQVMVLGTLIVQQFMERRNWPYAAATSVWLLAIVTIPIALTVVGGTGQPPTRMTNPERPRRA